jgi:hypothetical protein
MQTSTKRILILVLIAAICCLGGVGVYLGYQLLTHQGQESGPVVYFETPNRSNQLQTGSPIPIHIIASNQGKVTRLEFWVNGSLVKNQYSPLDAGISPFPLVTEWNPPGSGEYTLLARAYSGDGTAGTGEIRVTVTDAVAVDLPDRDADGYFDENDQCPDAAGPEPDGCPLVIPDADGDGVEDSRDECMDMAGVVIAEGCPDADADGLADDLDQCPAEVGAGDSPAGAGCPSDGTADRDLDGVPDIDDDCPDESGAADRAGCPAGGAASDGTAGDWEDTSFEDTDDDGVADGVDVCPDEAGVETGSGCPEGAPDADGDGYPDSVDLCVNEAGVEPDGCPAPGAESSAEEGGLTPGNMRFMAPARHFVEFQALSFQVAQAYDEVQCYASITSDPPQLYGPFHFDGGQSWDITEYLGSMILINPDSPIPVQLECEGYSGTAGAPVFHYIGNCTAEHAETEWDGRVLTAWVGNISQNGRPSEGFQATYRICDGSCTAIDLPAPALTMRDDPLMGLVLAWDWFGNQSLIDHFNIYINGSYARQLPGGYRGMQIEEIVSGSDETLTFQVSAEAEDGAESDLSNPVAMKGPEDERRVRVTFERIITYDVDDVRWNGEVGPLRGSFYANDQDLNFDAEDYPYGYRIASGGQTYIQSYFDRVNVPEGICSGYTCHTFSAPEVNYVEMELPEGTDLTVGARIMDAEYGDDDTLIDASETIPSDEIIPEYRVLGNGNVEVVYFIEVIDGPGSVPNTGFDPPDLAIERVEDHYGQLAVLVQNVGTGPLYTQPVTLQYFDRDTDELLFEATYPDIDLLVGESVWFSTGREDLPRYGTYAVVNPDPHPVEETDYTNNRYYTPIRLQVSFAEIYDPSMCDSYWHTYTEHRYHLSLMHGPNYTHSTQTTYLTYPERGTARIEYGSGNYSLYPAEEDSRYTVEIVVPYGDTLYVHLNGDELDGDPYLYSDSQGYILVEYPMEEYITMDNFEGSAQSIEDTCPDTYRPDDADYFGFGARWVITRLE